ncbi:MAG: aldehyde dehydrogenase [Gammaproteobacteria bacterium]|nr:MAG: aldehyde dehydrogenase [Gammaproteobacteria bacterium]
MNRNVDDVYGDDVAQFLDQETIPMFINGKWVSPEGANTIDVINPSNAEKIGQIYAGGSKQVDQACEAAHKAFETSGWATMPVVERSAILNRLADLIDDNAAVLGKLESLDVGKPVAAVIEGEIPFSGQAFRFFAKVMLDYDKYSTPLVAENIEAHYVRSPYGVCGFIFPWNFPFLLLAWGASAALAAGNTIVVKPAELTSLSTLYFCKLAKEAGIPDGVVNVITGPGAEVGMPIAEHPLVRRMAFTGSPEVGRKIASTCARNLIPVKLELGGKGAAIIFDDVDVKSAAASLAEIITSNTGQVCCTASRWLVHQNIYDEFSQEVSLILNNTVIGNSSDANTKMGPVVSEVQRQRILDYQKKGLAQNATALVEGHIVEPEGSEKGFYVTPSLLQGSADNICFKEEIFGPSAYMMSFSDEEEAINLVNSSDYGLANSIWTLDLERARRVAEKMVVGNCWINAHNVFAYGLPYGGVNLSGMGGGVNSVETFEDYLRGQTVARPL